MKTGVPLLTGCQCCYGHCYCLFLIIPIRPYRFLCFVVSTKDSWVNFKRVDIFLVGFLGVPVFELLLLDFTKQCLNFIFNVLPWSSKFTAWALKNKKEILIFQIVIGSLKIKIKNHHNIKRREKSPLMQPSYWLGV